MTGRGGVLRTHRDKRIIYAMSLHSCPNVLAVRVLSLRGERGKLQVGGVKRVGNAAGRLTCSAMSADGTFSMRAHIKWFSVTPPTEVLAAAAPAKYCFSPC